MRTHMITSLCVVAVSMAGFALASELTRDGRNQSARPISDEALYLVKGADGENGTYQASGLCESQSLTGNEVSQYDCYGNPGAPCVACDPTGYTELTGTAGGYHRNGTKPGCSFRQKKIGTCVNPPSGYECDNPVPTNPVSYCQGNIPNIEPQETDPIDP
jgi:hypothetical protein